MHLGNYRAWVICLLTALGGATLNIGLAQDAAAPQESLHSPCLGKSVTPADVKQFIYPDGSGLPEGKGSAILGEALFRTRCQSCHGPKGIGATAVELVGEHDTLDDLFPVKAVGSYWPDAPALLAYIQQAMPPQTIETHQKRLANDESYAVVAYILTLNNLWDFNDDLDAAKLAALAMPNKNGFSESILAQQASEYQWPSGCSESGDQ